MASMLFFVVVAASFVDVIQSACSGSASGSCQSTIQTLYGSSPASVSGYDTYCSTVSSTCSSTLTECSCTTSSSAATRNSCLDFLGLKDAIIYVCNSTDNRGVFTRNRECITEFVDIAVQTCRVVSSENCVGYNEAYRCFYAAMSVLCNKETAEMMTRFELKRYKPLLDDIQCTIDLGGASLSTCSQSNVDSCLQSVTSLYVNTPTSQSSYDTFCRQVSSTCSRTLTDCECTNKTSAVGQRCLDYLGLKAGMLYVCSNEENKKVFRENRQCIIDNTDTADQTCQSKYTKDCSGYLLAFKCFYETMKSKCNKDVADMVTTFKLFRYYPLLTSISCTFDESDISATGAASTLVSSTVLAVLMLIVVM